MRVLRLAAMAVAVTLVLALAYAGLWSHPARLATYRTPLAGGGTPVTVSALAAEPHGWWGVCVIATVTDQEGATRAAGALLPDTWTADVNGLLRRSATGHAVELSDPSTGGVMNDGHAAEVEALMLDLEDEHDAMRAAAWTETCGDAEAVVAVRP